MSHFTVLVVGAVGSDIDAALAPWDENLEVPRYKQYWDTKEIERWEKILADPIKAPNRAPVAAAVAAAQEQEPERYPDEQVLVVDDEGKASSFEELVRVYRARYGYDEGEEGQGPEDGPLLDETGIFEWHHYNPQGKWDWYAIGGRWTGYFDVKQRANGTAGEGRWHDAYELAMNRLHDEVAAVAEADEVVKKVFEPRCGNDPVGDSLVAIGVDRGGPEPETAGKADQILRVDVDADRMRAESALRAGELWDAVMEAVVHTEEAKPWSAFIAEAMEEAGGDDFDVKPIREAYGKQERVVAFKKALETSKYLAERVGMFAGVEEFQLPREEYVERARLAAIPTWAYVKDGRWEAPGNMGWFALSDETDSSQRDYNVKFNQMFDSLRGDTLLTLVDCHV